MAQTVPSYSGLNAGTRNAHAHIHLVQAEQCAHTTRDHGSYSNKKCASRRSNRHTTLQRASYTNKPFTAHLGRAVVAARRRQPSCSRQAVSGGRRRSCPAGRRQRVVHEHARHWAHAQVACQVGNLPAASRGGRCIHDRLPAGGDATVGRRCGGARRRHRPRTAELANTRRPLHRAAGRLRRLRTANMTTKNPRGTLTGETAASRQPSLEGRTVCSMATVDTPPPASYPAAHLLKRRPWLPSAPCVSARWRRCRPVGCHLLPAAPHTRSPRGSTRCTTAAQPSYDQITGHSSRRCVTPPLRHICPKHVPPTCSASSACTH